VLFVSHAKCGSTQQGPASDVLAQRPQGNLVPVEKVIRPTEAFRTGSEKVRAGTYTDADPGCNAR